MISQRSFYIAIVVVFIAGSQTYGQTAPEPKPNPELHRKAQALLSDTLTLARQLKNRENQVLSRVDLAELQWNDQEKSAREIYQEAFDLVRRAWTNLDPNDDEAPYTESSIINLRDRVIQSIARRDPAMARQLFEQMRVAGRSDTTNAEANANPIQRERADYDKRLETMIAVAAAENNSASSLGFVLG